ncbi:MAG: 4Fe-4S cluster-binding domain-containing protein [Ruminococcaceae bacterium]|nr:4Fe-4S cluster-binding domain-containing protein [Oscillospiraceae bacterium]
MKCELCPRRCGVDRTLSRGYCGMGEEITAAKAMLHYWEEPCISGECGSGAVFFSGCVLKCAYCQNCDISAEHKGKIVTEERLAEIFLELQQQGALNINLVNPTHFVPQIIRVVETAKDRGLTLPIVYNSGGYERAETLRMLDGLVDIYLPDIKYFDNGLAKMLSDAPDYFDTAMCAVAEMVRQTGKPLFSEDDMLLRGTIVRHLVLPGQYKDTIEIVKRVGERFGGEILFSLMSQYTPFGKVTTDTRLGKFNRRITTFEYRKALDAVYAAGLTGYMQEKSSAKEEYTPIFDLSGL